jgi:uncharacterized membrane protein YbhN (UPF0104 family)
MASRALLARVTTLLKRATPIGLAIASIVGLVEFVLRQNTRLVVPLSTLRGEFLALALLITIAASAAAGVVWGFLLVSRGARVRIPVALQIWWLATPSKYGIGVIGHYAGRIYLADKAGIPRSIALGSFAQEAILIIGSGIALIAALASAEPAYASRIDPRIVTVGPVLAIVLVVVLLAVLAVIGSNSRLYSPDWQKVRASLPVLLIAFGLMGLNWCLLGGTAYVLLNAFRLTDLALFPACVVSVTLGILIGMIGVTPMGLGVRELVLTLTLSQFAPVAEATAVVILHRLCTFIVELLCAGVAFIFWTRQSAFRANQS